MQRTLFPAVPNTAEAQWLGTVQALYAHLNQHGGQQSFKLFRGWMRDRNIYVKEEVDALQVEMVRTSLYGFCHFRLLLLL